MIKYFVGLCLMFASMAFGAEVGSFKDTDGWMLVLFNDQGPCSTNAVIFEVFNEVGSKEIGGCWKAWEDKVLFITDVGNRFLLEASIFTWK